MNTGAKAGAAPPFLSAQLGQLSMQEHTPHSCTLAIALAGAGRAPSPGNLGTAGAFPQAGRARAPETAPEWWNHQLHPERDELTLHNDLCAWTEPAALLRGRSALSVGLHRPSSLNYCFMHSTNFLDCAGKSKHIMKTFFPPNKSCQSK